MAGAALLEVGVVLILGEQIKFPRRVVGAPFGVRINQPNAFYRHKWPDGTVYFRINGQGMRADHDFAYEKPPGTKRIVSLGDSFTIGIEVQAEETFSSILERELRARGRAVEVLNAGVSGYGTAEEVIYLERELLRYDPDVVLISYFVNDLDDNIRADLFKLQGDRLVEVHKDYVPAGYLGDFLNTNPVFTFLSEYSNAFALLKDEMTFLAKKSKDKAFGEVPLTATETNDEATIYKRRLAAALYERVYNITRDRGIPLMIQSIPSEWQKPPYHLVEAFPLKEFNVNRSGIYFLSTKSLLDQWIGKELLYYRRGYGHWTPFSHAISGRALAALLLANRLVE